jgi:hypothetical protein
MGWVVAMPIIRGVTGYGGIAMNNLQTRQAEISVPGAI